LERQFNFVLDALLCSPTVCVRAHMCAHTCIHVYNVMQGREGLMLSCSPETDKHVNDYSPRSNCYHVSYTQDSNQ